jgi:hypothetical protein
VEVLPEGPFIKDEGPPVGEEDLAVGAEGVAGGALHPGVGGDDQVGGEPGTDPDGAGGQPVADAAEDFFAEEEEAEEGAFEEEAVEALHAEGVADDAAGGFGEAAPVGAEHKFHGDAGDDAESEIDGEDLGPEASGGVVALVAGLDRHGLQDEDEERETEG